MGQRHQILARLKTEVFDVLILGGGINGAGIARDLSLRARHAGATLRIGLVEQRHFASGTSGKNSQLIHGGLRYLKRLQFGLVREALRERAILLRLAPHLVEPLPFLMPLYSQFSRLYYGAGLALYDLLAGSRRLGRHRVLPREEVRRIEPDLAAEDLVCGMIFHDCRVHSARFVLANVLDAIRTGVAAANYVRAERWQREAGVFRVELVDALTNERFEARARKLVDTTGAWSQGTSLRLVRGSHIVLPRVNKSAHAVAWFNDDGRIVFFIPWGETKHLTLVGTTDIDHSAGPEDVRISPEETRYLLRVVRRLFPSADLTPVGAFSSLRALVRGESKAPSLASREHRIWNSPDGVLHIAGGKYTTYRAMSEEAADRICRELAPALARLHLTAETPLEDSPRPSLTFAIEHEMAQTLADVFFVSTYWGYERRWSAESLAPYADEMARLLDWDAARTEREIGAVLRTTALS